MATIPRYICIRCGRGFTTARSGRRHVKNVESGQGYITTEAHYRTQILTGQIPPPITPAPNRALNQSKKTVLDVADEEFIRGFYHRMGERAYEELQSEPETIKAKKMMFSRIIIKQLKERFS